MKEGREDGRKDGTAGRLKEAQKEDLNKERV